MGPRKLPQLSRSLGKHLAQFRQASEEFKRTWDREVTLEEINTQPSVTPTVTPSENSILDDNGLSQTIEPVAADQAVPRQLDETAALHSSGEPDSSSGTELSAIADQSEPSRKRDWL
jgi:Sec-independent protein translocase protein TatA